MKLNKIPKSELELLSYTEIAKMYLEENKITKNTADLFKEVCKLLELSDEEYVDKIADFFESLTTSKEFILLEDGTWDLKSNHKVKVVIEDIEDDAGEEDQEESENETEEIEEESDIDLINDDNFIDDDPDDDLADLTIVDDDELEE
ncbi:MAG: DNA-directed RNA polymerase subunit delta [Erysipelotrichaceae bacterium]|nr:DNA-directed RNA polymerase subunit delta [Erysipelotrichaceae bacterium]